MTLNDPDLRPLPASIYRNHAIVLLPRGDKWEVRTIYISPVCLGVASSLVRPRLLLTVKLELM